MFEVIEKDVERGDARLLLRCTECDEAIVVWGTLDEESTQAFEATEAHECPPTCCACGERLDDEDASFNVLACLPCRMDDPEGTQRAVTARIEAMTVAEMRDYLARERNRAIAS